MKKQDVILLIIFMILLSLVFYKISNRKKIIMNPEITCGKIIKASTTKSGGLLNFEYQVNDIKYNNSFGCTYNALNKFNSGHVNILVLYQKNNPKNSMIIENLNRLDEFNINYTDSIVLKCY
ncbi:MAG: hypothetical protein KF880_00010 [Ferruginibacter sp.]|nr:hypothetical protein [Ferruginibacter sp.]